MRAYQKTDKPYILRSLVKEGLQPHETGFEKANTYITNDGFFSYIIKFNFPVLLHFYVNPKDRNFNNSIILYRTFKRHLLERGYPSFIARVPTKDKPYFTPMVKWLTRRAEPYASKDNYDFYIVHLIKEKENG